MAEALPICRGNNGLEMVVSDELPKASSRELEKVNFFFENLSLVPVILGDLYSPIISWDFLFSSSPVSAHDDVSGSKVVSRGCVVTFWTSNGADKVDFCHLKSP